MKRISDCGKYELSKVNGELILTNIATKYFCNINHTYGEVASNEDICIDVITEEGIETTLVFFAHPWYGLKDNKGWLTRYPNTVDNYGNKLISREWIEEFLLLGGSIDGCAVWGIDPNASWVEVQSPAAIVNLLNLEHNHRWDNISTAVRYVSQAGLIISDDINWASWKALALGQQRQHTCSLAGITTNLTVMQLGWMKNSKWEFFVAQNATKFPAKSKYNNIEISYGYLFGVSLKGMEELYDSDKEEHYLSGFDDSQVTNPVWLKAKRDYLKYQQRRTIYRQVAYSTHVLHSEKVFAKIAKTHYLDLRIANHAKFRRMYNKINRSITTAGIILHSGNLVYLQTETSVRNKFLKVRKVGLYNVASATYAVQKGSFDVEYKKVVFAWTDSFQNHAEGSSVKEAITKLEGRSRIKGLIMSLNDIRNNANFCFAGTKQFLANRMRHVYELVKGFSSWNEVPEEIVNIQWELVSRDIFAGYPEP